VRHGAGRRRRLCWEVQKGLGRHAVVPNNATRALDSMLRRSPVILLGSTTPLLGVCDEASEMKWRESLTGGR
jgi:hypothetical protein